jgi:hypothetical protein
VARVPRSVGNGTVIVRDAEVVHPTSHVAAEPSEPQCHRDAPAAPRQATGAVLEVGEGFFGPTELGSSEGEPEEDALPDPRDGTPPIGRFSASS